MALTITRIPETYRLGFAKIKNLSPETVSAIGAAIDGLPMASNTEAIVAAVIAKVPALENDAEAIVRTIYSLYIYRASAGPDTSLPDFAQAIVRAMQSSGRENLILTEAEKEPYKEKLVHLLSFKTLAVSSKVDQLKADYASIFYDAKILTDIRPIFDEPPERPIGAAISHTLKIVYHDGGEHKELYLAMDTDSIQTLKKIAERAEAKGLSLKAFMQSSNLPDRS